MSAETWDGDAYLKVVKGEKVFMIDEDGKWCVSFFRPRQTT